MHKSSTRWVWLLIAAGLIGLLAWSAVGIGDTQAAPAQQATRTPRPKRAVGWATRRSARVPSGLTQTARTVPGANIVLGSLCDETGWPPGSQEFALVPDDDVVLLGLPYQMWTERAIAVEACDGVFDPQNRVTLTAPDGRVLLPHEALSTGIFDEPTNARVVYLLPESSLEGTYKLTVQAESETVVRDIQVRYSIPRIVLVDEAGNRIGRAMLGQVLEARYIGFQPNGTVEVGLYRQGDPTRGPAAYLELTLIDTWQLTADARGEYVEQTVVSPDAIGGQYVWVACNLDGCGPSLSFNGKIEMSWTWTSFGVASLQEVRHRSLVYP